MNYERPAERLASLADEYVVGTLTGRARRRFDRVLEKSVPARGAVRRAEDRLLPLDEALAPVQPSPAAWEAITRRLGDNVVSIARRRPRPAWMMALAAAVAIVALALGWFVFRGEAPRTVDVAQLRAAGGTQLWVIAIDPGTTRLAARASNAVARQANRDYELWALPEGGAPVSLGLLPATGRVERDLGPGQRDALRRATKVAVSLEPAGGSPTGAPTGPVLYVADLRLTPS
jgi:anti-sigma-K factor RskA